MQRTPDNTSLPPATAHIDRLQRSTGYNYMELMAMILIISIFAYAAYPQYKNYVVRSYWHANIEESMVIRTALEQCATENTGQLDLCSKGVSNNWTSLDLSYRSKAFIDGEPFQMTHGIAELIPPAQLGDLPPEGKSLFTSLDKKQTLPILRITGGPETGTNRKDETGNIVSVRCQVYFFPVWAPISKDTSSPDTSVLRWGVYYNNKPEDKCSENFVGISLTSNI